MNRGGPAPAGMAALRHGGEGRSNLVTPAFRDPDQPRVEETSPPRVREGWGGRGCGRHQKAAKRREKVTGRYLESFDPGLSFGTNRNQSETDAENGLSYIQAESTQTVSESQI
jgi:hypothetical protein